MLLRSPLDGGLMADGWQWHRYRHGDPLEETGGWPDWLESPYPLVDIGPCLICGHSMKRYSTVQNRWETMTSYACVWCQACVHVFHTGPPGHVPAATASAYAPPGMRWGEVFGGEPRRNHAEGQWGLTLCGLNASGLSTYGVLWDPDRAGVCPGCLTAAAEIDARWPVDRRGGGTFIVACPCRACRQPGTRAGR